MTVGSADGLWVGTPVRVAGVEVGSIDAIILEGDRAKLALRVRSNYPLPDDTEGQLKAQGVLGDYFVRLYPGTGEQALADGDVIRTKAEPAEIDAILRKVQDVSDDVAAITDVIRVLVEDRQNQEHVVAALANIDALTGELRAITEENHGDINAIADSVRRLTTSLEGYTADLAGDLDNEIASVQTATNTLNRSLDDIESITGKIDEGRGTIGALINERDTVDALNDTLNNTNAVVESFSGLRAEVYYTHRFYMGTQPTSGLEYFRDGNPLAFSGANTLGVRLKPQEDFWWNFELNDYPQGPVNFRERYDPITGEVDRRWELKDSPLFTFQMNKRWHNFALRIGVKENGGGVGFTYYALKDKLEINGDVFKFGYGAYPDMDSLGIPNGRFGARYEPFKNLYVEAGVEQPFLGIKRGFFTGYIGGGFYFQDDDIKLLLATLPLGF
jgi:phospholipid/cholesterol/gamma-HCH transport system substrate-binding protein